MHDFANNVKFDTISLPQNWSGNTPADTQFDGKDVSNYGIKGFLVHLGLAADVLAAGLKVAITLRESDDSVTGASGSGTWNTVDDASIILTTEAGTVLTVDATTDTYSVNDPGLDEIALFFEYRGNKKWVAIKFDFTGNFATGMPIGVTMIRTRANVPVV